VLKSRPPNEESKGPVVPAVSGDNDIGEWELERTARRGEGLLARAAVDNELERVTAGRERRG
jgi:hypothetical protein